MRPKLTLSRKGPTLLEQSGLVDPEPAAPRLAHMQAVSAMIRALTPDERDRWEAAGHPGINLHDWRKA